MDEEMIEENLGILWDLFRDDYIEEHGHPPEDDGITKLILVPY